MTRPDAPIQSTVAASTDQAYATRRAATAGDYAAICVAPILVFVMISSLTNFLMLLIYHGGQPARVTWVMLMFTMGVVGIARIAIEKDRAYSLGYAGVLGLATFVTIFSLVSSPIGTLLLLALVAVVSDWVIRDCTLIDEQADSSDRGLMQSLWRGKGQPGRSVLMLAVCSLPLFGLGQLFLGNRGVALSRAQWLLGAYLFSALTLLVTTSFLGLRRYLRQRGADMPSEVVKGWLGGGGAVVAVILLVAFLVPVPGRVVAALEVPRFLQSQSETRSSDLGWGSDGADQSKPNAASSADDASQADQAKKDGPQTHQDGAPPGNVDQGDRSEGTAGQQGGGDQNSSTTQASSDQQKGNQNETKSQNQPAQRQANQEADTNQNTSGRQETGNQETANRETGSQQKPKANSGSDSDSPSDSRDRQPTDAKSAAAEQDSDQFNQRNDDQPGGENEQENDARDVSDPSEDRPGSSNPSGKSSSDSEPSRASSSVAQQSRQVLRRITEAASGIIGLAKWLILLGLVGFVAYFVYAHLDYLRQIIGRLLAAKPSHDDSDLTGQGGGNSAQPADRRSFASFKRPPPGSSDAQATVITTFAAWDAWCHEQGWSRSKGETPSEFLARVKSEHDSSTQPAIRVVSSYNRIVYGRGTATVADLRACEALWDKMIAR